MNENRAYGNIEVYSPDDRLMFRANDNKLKFYIKNNLVEKVDDNKYKLLFEPKGLGYSERNKVLLEPRANRCVRCGEEDTLTLTRHHVLPYRFRKHMPDNIKGNNYRYVVFLCCECHGEYAKYENEYNDQIAADLGIKTLKQCNDDIYVEKRIIIGIADSLLYKKNIPEDRVEILRKSFLEHTGMEPINENLLKVMKKKYEPVSKENNFGKIVVESIKNIYEFQQSWLEHFVKHMQPKYLPNDLQILLSDS